MRSPSPRNWLILVLFAAFGVALTAFEPTRTLAIGPAWLAVCLLISGFYGRMIWKAKRLERLRRTGVAAQAVARSVKDLGLAVHEMPMVQAELDVQAPGGGYGVTKKVIVPRSQLRRLEAGEPFPVKVDPGDPDALAFEWPEGSDQRSSWIARAHGGPATIDAAALQKETEALVSEGASPERSL